jgi:hypothetical protein
MTLGIMPRFPARGGRAATRHLRTLAGAALMTVALTLPASAQTMPASLSQFLQGTIGFTADEVSSATRGMPVVKQLPTTDKREVAFIGVQAIDVPRAFYVARASDFPAALREPSRAALGVFSDPAVPADVATLALPHDDVKSLAQCQPGNCKLTLPAPSITDIRATIDLGAPSADSATNAYFGRRMIQYVTAYRARGNAALVVYDDAKDSASAAQVWDGIVSRSPYIYRYAPTLDQFLRNYPKDRLPGAREVIYWSQDNVPGIKPLLSITQELVYAPAELSGTTFIASKQLYCDHYLDGALDLVALIDRSESPAPDSAGIYLVMLRRIHFDDLPSGGIINVKGKVIGKTHDRTVDFLRETKKASEQAYASQHAGPG